MIPDRLYDLALIYKKGKLWKKLWDSQLFGVRFSDGEIGYCCVMGMMGELNAIAVYPGHKGLDSLRVLHDSTEAMDELARMEHIHCQDCMMLSFVNKRDLLPQEVEDIADYCQRKGVVLRGKNAFPQFERFREGYERWLLDDEADQRRMAEGIEAALEVARRLTEEMKTPEMLGLSEGLSYDKDIPLLTREGDGYRWESHLLPPRAKVEWPPILVDDDLSVARLEKAPRKGEWAAHLFRHVMPLSNEAESGEISIDDMTQAAFYPWALIAINAKSGLILAMNLSDDPDDYTRALGRTLVDAVTSAGMPKKIIVIDDRTQQALSAFCQRFGVALERKKRCKALTDALDDMVEHMVGMDEEDMEFSADDMIEALRRPEVLREMPDEVLLQILNVTPDGVLPDDIMKSLEKEAKRRGFFKG